MKKTEYGSSDNWYDVAKAWPDPDRYEYTGREIKIVDNIRQCQLNIFSP